MKVTHFGHACVAVETATTRLLIDPGILSWGYEGLRDLDGILITHHHADHLDLAKVEAMLRLNPRARLCVDAGTVDVVRNLGLDATVAQVGRPLTIGGAEVLALGGSHAMVHPRIPVVPNVGYLIDDGAVFHPGDSFTVPEKAIDILMLPTGGPWLKLGEAIDYLDAIAPRVAVPVHEGALASTYTHHGYLARLAPTATSFVELAHGRETSF